MDKQKTDTELLNAFKDTRDAVAFTLLATRHLPRIIAAAERILGNRHDAEEAAQKTLLTFATKCASIRQPELLGNWLYGVAIRHAKVLRRKNIARHQRNESFHQMLKNEQASSPSDSRWEDIKAHLDDAIACLPSKLRQVTIAHYLQGLSYKEMESALSLTENGIRWRLEEARKRLRKHFIKRGTALSGLALGSLISKNSSAQISESEIAELIQKTTGSPFFPPPVEIGKITQLLLQKYAHLQHCVWGLAALQVGVLLFVADFDKDAIDTSLPSTPESVANTNAQLILNTQITPLALEHKPPSQKVTRNQTVLFPQNEEKVSTTLLTYEDFEQFFRKILLLENKAERYKALRMMGITLSQQEFDHITFEKDFSVMQTRILDYWTKLRPAEALTWLLNNKFHEGEKKNNYFIEAYPLRAARLWLKQDPTQNIEGIRQSLPNNRASERLFALLPSWAEADKIIVNQTLIAGSPETHQQRLQELGKNWPIDDLYLGLELVQHHLRGDALAAFFEGIAQRNGATGIKGAFDVLQHAMADEKLSYPLYYNFMEALVKNNQLKEAKALIQTLNSKEKLLGIESLAHGLANHDVDQAIEWLGEINNPEEYNQALERVLINLSPEEFTDNVAAFTNEGVDPDTAHSILNACYEYCGQNPITASQIVDQLQAKELIAPLPHFDSYNFEKDYSPTGEKRKAIEHWENLFNIALFLVPETSTHHAADWLNQRPYQSEKARFGTLKEFAKYTWRLANPDEGYAWITQSNLNEQDKEALRQVIQF